MDIKKLLRKKIGEGEKSEEKKESGHQFQYSLPIQVQPERISEESGSGSDREEEFEIASEADKITAVPPYQLREGRGRPPTTGEYVGLTAAKSLLIEKEKEAIEVEMEKKAATNWGKAKRRAIPTAGVRFGGGLEEEDKTMKGLKNNVEDGVNSILEVVRTSGRLKGTHVRILKEAALAIRATAETMSRRTKSEENDKLQMENDRLRNEVSVLQMKVDGLGKELEALQEKVSRMNMMPAEEKSRAIEGKDDRVESDGIPREKQEKIIEALIERAAKRVQEREVELSKLVRKPIGESCSSISSAVESSAPKPARVRKDRRNYAESLRPRTDLMGKQRDQELTGAEGGAKPDKQGANGEWKIVKNKRKENRIKGIENAKGKATQIGKQEVARSVKRKVKPPRTAAVVVSIRRREEGEEEGAQSKRSMGETLAGIRDAVSLKALGVEALRPRRAATGAIIYEVFGPDRSAGADRLAARLKEVLDDKEMVVNRPVKKEDIRISGLDDATITAEVANALAKAGGIKEGEIRVGTIRRSVNGLGAVWAQLPSEAAKKVIEAGRLVIGWVMVRTEVLQPRPLRCFRCLEAGHTRIQCRSSVDRSRRCYRCGSEGHRANNCSAKVRCPLCADMGRPHDHIYGGEQCRERNYKGGKEFPERGGLVSNTDGKRRGEENTVESAREGGPDKRWVD